MQWIAEHLKVLHKLGSIVISYFSMKQTFMALSSTKVKYIETSNASHEVIWLHKLLAGMFERELDPTII